MQGSKDYAEDLSATPVGICRAAARGDLGQVRDILRKRPELLDARYPQRSPWRRGIEVNTPLEFAAEGGHAEVAVCCVEARSLLKPATPAGPRLCRACA